MNGIEIYRMGHITASVGIKPDFVFEVRNSRNFKERKPPCCLRPSRDRVAIKNPG